MSKHSILQYVKILSDVSDILYVNLSNKQHKYYISTSILTLGQLLLLVSIPC